MSNWNVWRCIASYRSWIGWCLVGCAFAAAYKFGWIDGAIVREVWQGATSVIGALKGGPS